jgi:hypothetical protein
MRRDWCIENDFAAQKEMAEMERHGIMLVVEENRSLRAQLAASEARCKRLEEALREARDFIMSGPIAGDDAAIVNKISRALEGE